MRSIKLDDTHSLNLMDAGHGYGIYITDDDSVLLPIDEHYRLYAKLFIGFTLPSEVISELIKGGYIKADNEYSAALLPDGGCLFPPEDIDDDGVPVICRYSNTNDVAIEERRQGDTGYEEWASVFMVDD